MHQVDNTDAIMINHSVTVHNTELSPALNSVWYGDVFGIASAPHTELFLYRLFFNGHGDLGDGVGHYVERVLM
jgi:hypothetical protein